MCKHIAVSTGPTGARDTMWWWGPKMGDQPCSQAEENDYTTAPRQNNWTAEHGRRAEMLGEVDAEETGRIRAR
jgi:hypothetical protein